MTWQGDLPLRVLSSSSSLCFNLFSKLLSSAIVQEFLRFHIASQSSGVTSISRRPLRTGLCVDVSCTCVHEWGSISRQGGRRTPGMVPPDDPLTACGRPLGA